MILTLGRKKNTDFVCHLGKNSYFCTVFLMIHYYKNLKSATYRV